MKYILALDQGTTSSRAVVFDERSRIVASAQKEFTQIFPKSGWVEHDPGEIWAAQTETALEAIARAGLEARDIAAAGIANQRETALLWDKKTGAPIHNAIVWQDRRTARFCTEIKKEFGDFIRRKTGLETDAYFSASKIRWLLENVPGASEKAAAGELLFGTIDTWLVWKFTGGRRHLTDASNASRTLLFDIRNLTWDEELLEIFQIPASVLPEVRSSSEVYGEIETPDKLRGIKISGIAGDQQAALFGQTCFDEKTAKNTYGTGCFLLQNTGGRGAVQSKNKLLTTVAWQLGAGENVKYALEGSVFIGGAVVGWLRDFIEIIKDSDEIEALAGSVEDTGGVYFVPAFAGLGAPFWNQEARGLIIGLTRGTGKAHIARAALESIAFQTADLLEAMQKDSGAALGELRADGGASRNDSLLQFQSDILQIPVVRSKIIETTALGAAYLAGLAVGFWNSPEDLKNHRREDKRFEPGMPAPEAAERRERWSEAVRRSLNWEDS